MTALSLVLSAAVLALVGTADAQSARTVQDGVYSKAQAERGLAAFQETCGACHGFDMNGTAGGPRLMGSRFMLHWANKPASDLVAMMRKEMPLGNPHSLPDETYVDIAAAIFQANQFPSNDGSTLTEEGLRTIQITQK